MWKGREKRRLKKAVEGLEVQGNLEVEKLTINQRGCWFSSQIGIFQLNIDNYKSLEESPDAPKLVQGLCAETDTVL